MFLRFKRTSSPLREPENTLGVCTLGWGKGSAATDSQISGTLGKISSPLRGLGVVTHLPQGPARAHPAPWTSLPRLGARRRKLTGPGAPGMLGEDSLSPLPPRGPSGGIRQPLSAHNRAAGRQSLIPLPRETLSRDTWPLGPSPKVSSSHEGGGLLWAGGVFSLSVPLAPPDSRLASPCHHSPISLQSAAPPPWDCSPSALPPQGPPLSLRSAA